MMLMLNRHSSTNAVCKSIIIMNKILKTKLLTNKIPPMKLGVGPKTHSQDNE